jgi:hypothetical protein
MLLAVLFILATPASVASDSLFAVEVYGLRSVPEAAIRSAIGVRAGDPVPQDHEAIRSRVRAVPGVAQVDVSVVCCSNFGTPIMYVGVRESMVPPITYRASPSGDIRLPPDLLAVGARFASAMEEAVRRGSGAEDHSRGYALSEDSAVRSLQQEFIDIAARDFDLLSNVLEHSADPTHRAIAAHILAYGENKQEIVSHLLYAADDHDEVVRNNAVRALGVLAQWANENVSSGVSIPPYPFITLLNSVLWTDRNKGVFVLMSLSASRKPTLLDELRTESSESLIEMARWCNPGHALGPYMILARIAGIDDSEAFQAWQEGEKETMIRRAQALLAEISQLRQPREPNCA